MKRIYATVLLAFAFASPVFAADTPFYGGLSIGPSSIASSSSTAIGIFAGYRLNNVKMGGMGTLALEAQYTSLGSDLYGDNFASVGVDAVAFFPIKTAQNLSIFGTLGLNSISGNFSCGNLCSYTSSSGLVLDAGFGGQYRLSSEFSVRAGYEYYDNNFSALYAAGIYNF
ncbi:MAG: outer membrane beta-barrel protein [Gallionella sp.]